jgi:formylglycine-generating enzyme required for sulfatase activity
MSRFVLALILFGLSTGVGFGQEVTVELTNSIGMKLVLIPKGTFTMGSPSSEYRSEDGERPHEVTRTRDYYLGAFEVTQAHFEKVMGYNSSYF